MDNDLIERLRPLANKYAMNGGGRVAKDLAAGGSAAVYVVQEPSREYALKVYAPELLQGRSGPAELKRIELQRRLIGHKCHHLVQLHKIHVDGAECYVDMEYVPWDTLKKVLPQVPNEVVPRLLEQLVSAAKYLDDLGIVHRDIKPENILVSPDFSELRLIDLGVVRVSDASEDATDATDQGYRRPFVATAQYSSPEYLFRLTIPSADMWRALTFYQLGGVIHDMLVKRPLFAEAARSENKHVISMAVFRETPSLSDAAPEHAAIAALAVHCLTKDAELRLRLVSWERFVSPDLTGTDRLRAMNAQAMTTAQARRALEQTRRQRQLRREQYVGQLHERVRKGLIEIGSQAYKTASYASAADGANFELRLPSGAVLHLLLLFDWRGELEANRATVTLLGALNSAPHPATNRQAAIGEADTHASVDALVDAALDRLGHVTANTRDQMTAGLLRDDADGHADLIVLSGLA